MTKPILAAAMIAAALITAACSRGEDRSSENSVAPAPAVDCRPLTEPDLGRAADIMHAEGLDVSQGTSTDGAGYLVWTLDGSEGFISVGRAGTHLNVAFNAGESAGENVVNTWNDDMEFSRTYLDHGGSAVLEMDLDYEGGICEDNVRAFFRKGAASHALWKRTVVGQ
ncbi:MAG: YbjN domain-containing protein [Deltaproteobacteria bacterium]|jgi:hypothetical protein|nr:YbjN domain-containing protein [Deltaproteobacteria bacterium]